ncbi:MAG TPA: 2-isopropylmalate synthase [Syntrophales bacterium]|nr:2-isopropylmalate synthase [Syntrophales bacterium]HPX55049.1 2-isopropylmalate synthase [Syntrophales bacterium]HQA81919.1 2-isopropylmalate synthase [Syntrophales bacterium]
MNTQNNRVYIFDTTLRDGEQSPGCSMNPDEKIRIARQLEKMGVDIIEAGFPVASDGDFLSVQQIAREIRGSQIAGLARANLTDIDRAWEAIKDAANPRIHTFISSSDIHLKYQLKKSREQVLKEARAAVKHACGFTANVEFSPMDATRSDRDYLCEMVEAVIAEGAKTVNIPDTVGYAIPEEFGGLIAYLFERVKNINQAIISVHCHNDLGLAVANSLAALRNGARQVECTINGIGERAGNTAMEEIVMALETRKDLFGLKTNIKTPYIYPSSRLLTQITGVAVQPNKAIVGANAFAHESGIHQDGLIKEKITYEIMTPQSVGISDSNIVLGKHSGRHAISEHLRKMGYNLTNEQLNKVAASFKELADVKKDIFDEDLEAIVYEQVFRSEDKYKLEYLNVVSGSVAIPTATMRMMIDGEMYQDAGFGIGPVDATFSVIRKITRTNYPLLKYAVNAITGGTDAQGEVMVQLRYNGRSVIGHGAHPDVLVASARAYINALNRLEWLKTDLKKVEIE